MQLTTNLGTQVGFPALTAGADTNLQKDTHQLQYPMLDVQEKKPFLT